MHGLPKCWQAVLAKAREMTRKELIILIFVRYRDCLLPLFLNDHPEDQPPASATAPVIPVLIASLAAGIVVDWQAGHISERVRNMTGAIRRVHEKDGEWGTLGTVRRVSHGLCLERKCEAAADLTSRCCLCVRSIVTFAGGEHEGLGPARAQDPI